MKITSIKRIKNALLMTCESEHGPTHDVHVPLEKINDDISRVTISNEALDDIIKYLNKGLMK